MSKARYARGEAHRRKVWGDKYVDKATADINSFDRPFQNYVTENVFGRTWSSGILTVQELSLINLGMLAAAGRMDAFELHFRSALLYTKVPLAVLRETLMHITIYCGAATGRDVFVIAQKVLKEEKVDLSILDQVED
jgi:4-carboxymuconolactone decarboxylase